jgi:hypothetical protein
MRTDNFVLGMHFLNFRLDIDVPLADTTMTTASACLMICTLWKNTAESVSLMFQVGLGATKIHIHPAFLFILSALAEHLLFSPSYRASHHRATWPRRIQCSHRLSF